MHTVTLNFAGDEGDRVNINFKSDELAEAIRKYASINHTLKSNDLRGFIKAISQLNAGCHNDPVLKDLNPAAIRLSHIESVAKKQADRKEKVLNPQVETRLGDQVSYDIAIETAGVLSEKTVINLAELARDMGQNVYRGEVCVGERDYVIILMSFYQTMRPGQFSTLTWQDICWRHKTIILKNHWGFGTGYASQRTPKDNTYKIHPQLLTALEWYRELSTEGYVFKGRVLHQPLQPTSITSLYKVIFKLAHMKNYIPQKAFLFRKSGAYHLAWCGKNIEDIADHMGLVNENSAWKFYNAFH